MAELDFTDCPGNKPSLNIVDNRKRDLWRFYSGNTLVSRVNYLGQRISNAGDKYKYLSIGLKDIAADSDGLLYPLMRLDKKVTISAIYLSVDTTQANDGDNYQTIAAKDEDGNTIASITTAVTGFTLATPRTMGTIDSTHGVLNVNEGMYLEFTKTGTGMALSGMVVHIAYTVNNTYANSHSIDEDDPPLLAWIDSPDASEVILSDRDAGNHLNFNNGAFEVRLSGKVRTTSVDKHETITCCLGDITASGPTPAIFGLLKPSYKCRVKKVHIGADTSLALASDSNYLTLKVVQYDGSNQNEICRTTIGGPYAQGQALTAGELSKIADFDNDDMVTALADIESTDTIWITLAKTGTGGTNVSNLTVQITYEKID